MKKIFIAALALLMFAGVAYAADVEVTGSYYARGRYLDNTAMNVDGGDPFMNYDHELDLRMKVVMSEQSFIYTRWEILDENWPGDAGTGKGDALDDNLEVQRLYGSHTFGNGGTLDTGLMTGGGWASSFGETTGGRYRVKYTQPTGFGTVIGLLEKKAELGSSAEKSEANDADGYAIALVTMAGDFKIMPLLFYVADGTGDLTDDKLDTTTVFDLGVEGSFGAFALVSEFKYESRAYEERDLDDYSVWGIYVDLSTTLDAWNVGGFLAYGSVDEDGGSFAFGDDFDGNGSEMIGNEFEFGAADSIGGSTYAGVYGGYAVSEELSFTGHLGYAVGNSDLDQNNAAESDTCLALSLGGAYKIADGVTYGVGFGYATITRDEGSDPDPGMKLWHKITWAF